MLNYTISGNYRTNKTATLFIINNDISLNYCLFRDDYSICSIPGVSRGHRRQPAAGSRYGWVVIDRFIKHLVQAGEIEPFESRRPTALPDLLNRFSFWRERDRGNSEATRRKHVRAINALFADWRRSEAL